MPTLKEFKKAATATAAIGVFTVTTILASRYIVPGENGPRNPVRLDEVAEKQAHLTKVFKMAGVSSEDRKLIEQKVLDNTCSDLGNNKLKAECDTAVRILKSDPLPPPIVQWQ